MAANWKSTAGKTVRLNSIPPEIDKNSAKKMEVKISTPTKISNCLPIADGGLLNEGAVFLRFRLNQ